MHCSGVVEVMGESILGVFRLSAICAYTHRWFFRAVEK
jgi:hypothetical protein